MVIDMRHFVAAHRVALWRISIWAPLAISIALIVFGFWLQNEIMAGSRSRKYLGITWEWHVARTAVAAQVVFFMAALALTRRTVLRIMGTVLVIMVEAILALTAYSIVSMALTGNWL